MLGNWLNKYTTRPCCEKSGIFNLKLKFDRHRPHCYIYILLFPLSSSQRWVYMTHSQCTSRIVWCTTYFLRTADEIKERPSSCTRSPRVQLRIFRKSMLSFVHICRIFVCFVRLFCDFSSARTTSMNSNDSRSFPLQSRTSRELFVYWSGHRLWTSLQEEDTVPIP